MIQKKRNWNPAEEGIEAAREDARRARTIPMPIIIELDPQDRRTIEDVLGIEGLYECPPEAIRAFIESAAHQGVADALEFVRKNRGAK